MRILVTGADGFVGGYLVPALQKRGHNVVAGLLNQVNDLYSNLEIVCFNIVDEEQVNQVISKLQPDGIIHLAAQSMVKFSWENPVDTLMVNTIGTINIINAVSRFSRTTKVITIGSSEEYGLTGMIGRPLVEEDCCLPQNPYATSKLAAGQIAMQLALKDKINVIHVRPFNHFGPYQQRGFVVSDFASQIVNIEKSLCEPVIYVGDLTAHRDFTDVRDVIEAYILLLEKDVATGIYNVCSGEPHTAGEILDVLVSNCHMNVQRVIDQSKFRLSNVPIFIGSINKISSVTGWKPNRNFNDSIIETLNWWRKQ